MDAGRFGLLAAAGRLRACMRWLQGRLGMRVQVSLLFFLPRIRCCLAAEVEQ